MHLKPVNSRSLYSIGYDASNLLLEVKFKISGRIYAFYNVKEDIYQAFLAAKSKGHFFKKYIKDKYQAVKIK